MKKLLKPTAIILSIFSGYSFAAIVNYQGGAGSMGDITISATVADACDISINDLNFGAYDPNSATADTSDANITYQCTSGSTPTLSFSTTTLEMSGPGSDVITYTLHQGSGGSGTAWNSTNNYPLATATGASQNATYSGNIPINQFVEAGSYDQNLTITLSF